VRAAASAAFITYNGYWLLVAVVLLVHIVRKDARRCEVR
jgi:hypothetical protein